MSTKSLGEIVLTNDIESTVGQVLSVVAQKPLFTIKYRAGSDIGTVELDGDKVTLTTDYVKQTGIGTLVVGKTEMYYRGSAGFIDIDLRTSL